MGLPQNHVHILGNLGSNPEITKENDRRCARFQVAARESYVNAEGKRVENTEWVSIVAWDGLANIAEKHLTKGRQVAICGKIHTREYTDAKGERKWITEVVASDILLLGSKEDKAVGSSE